LRLKPEIEHVEDGRAYRLVSLPNSEGMFELEMKKNGRWQRQYAFTLQPHELADFAAMCNYHQTSPDSHFTRQRICTLASPDGRITLSDKKLIETHQGVRKERSLSSEEEWRATLRELFGVVLPK
jgi:N-hydroxyarylamine O-acetyltransferase